MKKYCFLMTGTTNWLSVAKELRQKNIAEPVLWLGDDKHVDDAKKYFGPEVVTRMLDFVHYQQRIPQFEYDGEYSNFFYSDNYLRAKDRCLKMMDRLDLYGTFARIDREAVFNKLTKWFLKRLSETSPEFLLMVEAPHSHAQYLLYEIALFLEIKTYKFNSWTISPLLYLQDMDTGSRLEKNFEIEKKISDLLEKDTHKFIDEVIKSQDADDYEVEYMKKQRLNNTFIKKILNIKTSSLKELIKTFIFEWRFLFRTEYHKVNPFRYGIYLRSKVKRLKKRNLMKSFSLHQDEVDISKKFVYFPLHFEPERTTNPDGGLFHDQLIAIVALRKILPDDIGIVVKEHPSQFYISERGSRGRSPLFYDNLKNIKNLTLASLEINTLSLIKSSIFVSSISGSVCLEAAILGKKSLMFGDSWFRGCPNTINWSEELSYSEIHDSKTFGPDKIIEFLRTQQNLHCVPGFHNPSSFNRFNTHHSQSFFQESEKNIVLLLTQLFNSKLSN